MTGLLAFMQAQPILVFFLVVSLGYLVGRIAIGGISLGAAGGVLLVGLFFGHYGLTMYPEIQTLGFAIFIFCVGYQAGPQFFDVLLTSGLKYLSLAVVIAATGMTLAVVLSNALAFDPGISAGLLGGALTTTPTLAAAQDAVRSGIVEAPAGFTEDQVLTNIGAGYALTYLFGLIGLILTIRVLPRVLSVDLPAEARRMEAAAGGTDELDLSNVSRRTYRVTREDLLQTTVAEYERRVPGSLAIIGIRRDGELVDLDFDTRLQLNDEVLIVGQTDFLIRESAQLGEEIADDEGLRVPMEVMQVVVSNPAAMHTPLRDLRPADKILALPIQVRRQRSKLPLSLDLVLHRGDVITFYGPRLAIDRLAKQVGHVEQDVVDTDLFTFGLGIAGGIALGTLAITVGGISLGLGMAGGLLVTGLLIGFLRSIYPVFGRVPSASRWVLMELGLMMFMAGVGLNAGGGIVEIIKDAGPQLIGAGMVVTLIPIFVGYAFSTKILRLNPVEALGGVTGAMTSGAALSVVCDAAESNVPALGYTGAYAFANVILTLAGTIIMLL